MGCWWQPSAFILFTLALREVKGRPGRSWGKLALPLHPAEAVGQGPGRGSASFRGRYSSRLFPPFCPLLLCTQLCPHLFPSGLPGCSCPHLSLCNGTSTQGSAGPGCRGLGVPMSLKLPPYTVCAGMGAGSLLSSSSSPSAFVRFCQTWAQGCLELCPSLCLFVVAGAVPLTALAPT